MLSANRCAFCFIAFLMVSLAPDPAVTLGAPARDLLRWQRERLLVCFMIEFSERSPAGKVPPGDFSANSISPRHTRDITQMGYVKCPDLAPQLLTSAFQRVSESTAGARDVVLV